MAYYRKNVVDIMLSWDGCVKGDKTHEAILNIYNGNKPLPRGVMMLKTYAWCACTVSAAFIKAGYQAIFPIECGCGEMIAKAKEMKCWKESDSYVPKPGDVVFYDWDDSGVGDNVGWPEHVGMVVSCNGKTFVVQEGNYKGGCYKRTMEVNGRYIRGFVAPAFTADSAPVVATTVKEPVKILDAKSFEKGIAGTYVYTGEGRKLRRGPGNGYTSLVTLPKGAKMYNYGYYTKVDNVKWLLVEVVINKVKYTGFVSTKNYVKKI